MAASNWESQLAEAGCRITSARRAVIRVLQEASAPLSPHEIVERARGSADAPGVVTVYRTLSLLIGLGLVRRVHVQDGCHAYLAASPGHTHVVVCQGCGRAVEFAGSDEVDMLQKEVEASTGFRIEDHLLQFQGICPNCQRARGCK